MREEIYTLLRKWYIKTITNDLGIVIEEEDKLICYVDKNKFKGSNLCINCSNFKNKILADRFRLNKKIVYVIDGFDEKYSFVEIESDEDCEVIIKNSAFSGEVSINAHGNLYINSVLINDVNSFNLFAESLKINKLDIMSEKTCECFINAISVFELNNSNIDIIKGNVRLLTHNSIKMFNSKIRGNEVDLTAKKSIHFDEKSFLEAFLKLKLCTQDLSDVNVKTPKLIYNSKLVKNMNKSFTFSLKEELNIQRGSLIQLLKNLKEKVIIDNLSEKDNVGKILSKIK